MFLDRASRNARFRRERSSCREQFEPGGIYFIEDIESPQRKICEPFQPTVLSRDKILYWVDQLMIFPRNTELDLPKGLQSITCQRESCAFHKCPADAVRCP